MLYLSESVNQVGNVYIFVSQNSIKMMLVHLFSEMDFFLLSFEVALIVVLLLTIL
jgi:L-asparagine transporter-like permease